MCRLGGLTRVHEVDEPLGRAHVPPATTVLVSMGGGEYNYEGRTYRSLSVIAREITGTRWSGPAFFGLKARLPAAAKTKQASTTDFADSADKSYFMQCVSNFSYLRVFSAPCCEVPSSMPPDQCRRTCIFPPILGWPPTLGPLRMKSPLMLVNGCSV